MISCTKQQIIGNSPPLQEVLRIADLISGTDVPVLISGDTGTGKDLFANRIHHLSQRKKRTFIKVNCTSMSDDLTENALFENADYFEKAHNGTLFLDDISGLSESQQGKLLHFLESSELISSKEKSAKKYNVRIIASTNQHLLADVESGHFRADLYYRLNIIPLELPTLAERKDDINLIIDYFFRLFVHEKHQTAPAFSKAALKQILRYEWPGNIRELHNFCERMFILFSGKVVDVTNLPYEISSKSHKQNSPFSLPATGIKLEALEVDFILQALKKTGGNKSKAARMLGLTRDTFLYRLKKYSIDI